jgi:hypothetical protein
LNLFCQILFGAQMPEIPNIKNARTIYQLRIQTIGYRRVKYEIKTKLKKNTLLEQLKGRKVIYKYPRKIKKGYFQSIGDNWFR